MTFFHVNKHRSVSSYKVVTKQRTADMSKKVVTVFIDFNYNNRNKSQKIYIKMTNYEPINLTQKPGLMGFYQYMIIFDNRQIVDLNVSPCVTKTAGVSRCGTVAGISAE